MEAVPLFPPQLAGVDVTEAESPVVRVTETVDILLHPLASVTVIE
jgi:hypothetical protein